MTILHREQAHSFVVNATRSQSESSPGVKSILCNLTTQGATASDGNHTDLTKTADKDFLVPNIVHYIWYMDQSVEFIFDKAISVLSAAKNLKPDAIYFHTNNPPHGKYFDMVKKLPNFKVGFVS